MLKCLIVSYQLVVRFGKHTQPVCPEIKAAEIDGAALISKTSIWLKDRLKSVLDLLIAFASLVIYSAALSVA